MNLPQNLLDVQANAESGGQDFTPNGQPVTSPAGAMYKMQVMPNTATNPGFGVTPAQDNSPQEMDRVGKDYMSALYNHYGDLPTALAAYNWGPGNVDKYGVQNAPPETKSYIQKIMGGIGNAIVPPANASEMPQPTQAASNFDVTMPDGTTIKDVPQGTTQSQLQAKYAKLATTQSSQPETPMVPGMAGQFAKGALFGLGDEAIAGTAAMRSAFDKGSLSNVSDDYNDALSLERNSEKNFQQQHPYISAGSQLAGGLASAYLGAKTAPGAAIAETLGTGNLPARIAKNALVGTASGGLYGFGTGEGDFENRLNSAESGAISGGLTGGAIPVAGAALNSVAGGAKNIAKGLFADNPEVLGDIADDMKSSAGDIYNQMRQEGATFNPAKSGDIISGIDTALQQNKFIPNLNPKTLAIVDDLKDAASKGTLGLDDLDQYRRLLGRVGGSEDGVSAGTVRKAIDDAVNSTKPTDLVNPNSSNAINLLNQGRAAYSQASRFEAISDVLAKANGDPNRIKSGLTRFLANDNNTRGFNDAEMSALKDAANTGIGENILKAFGKFGIDFSKSGTGNTVLPALMSLGKVGGASLVPGGIPAVAGATLMRQGQKYIARGKAQNLLDTIMQNKAAANQAFAQGGNAASSAPLSLGANYSAAILPQLMGMMK